MSRSEGKFSSWSPSSTLFQRGSFCSLSDWILRSLYSPISNSTSLEQGWDPSCSHYTSSFYVDYWDLNSPCLHAKLFGPLHCHSSLLCPIFGHSFYKSLLMSPCPWNSVYFQPETQGHLHVSGIHNLLPMEESLLATCRGQNLVLKGRRFTSIIS